MSEIRKEEQELVEQITKLVSRKFITDNTGERIDGWLAFNVGQHEALVAKGDLREFCTIARPEHIEQFIQENLLPLIRSHTNALIGAAFEACAKHCPTFFDSAMKPYIVVCSCGWKFKHTEESKIICHFDAWAEHIRSLAPEAARAALERIEAEARLEELHDVNNLMEDCYMSMSQDPDDVEFDEGQFHAAINKRIAELTAAAKESK